MDDIRLDAARPQPARQPETVPASLEGQHHPGNLTAGAMRLRPPARNRLQQQTRLGSKLLQRPPSKAGNDAGGEPA